MKNKELLDEKKTALIELTKSFCEEQLSQEYSDLCEKMINKMARKRQVPFMTGRLNIWAAAIIHALGTINFLFDKNTQPYTTVTQICEFFGTSKSTTGQKSKLIRDMFKLGYFDAEFSTKTISEENPFANIVMVNGLPIPIDMLNDLKKK